MGLLYKSARKIDIVLLFAFFVRFKTHPIFSRWVVYKCKNSKDGHKSICKKCISEFNKNNIEKNRIRSKNWRKNNPDYKIRRNSCRKMKYIENKEEILTKNTKWRNNNKEKIRISNLKYLKPLWALENLRKHNK